MVAASHLPLTDPRSRSRTTIRRSAPFSPIIVRRPSTTRLRRVSRCRGTYTSTCLLRFALSVCFFFPFCFFIVTHPYACYELFKKFALALSLVLLHSLRPFSLFLSLSFFSGFSRWFFRTKQNGIFLALEEKIHSSTFISFLIRLSPSLLPFR